MTTTKLNPKVEEQTARNDKLPPDAIESLLQSDQGLLWEVVRALKTIQYGSIVLTIHNGQLVEVSKNIRIRRSEPNNGK